MIQGLIGPPPPKQRAFLGLEPPDIGRASGDLFHPDDFGTVTADKLVAEIELRFVFVADAPPFPAAFFLDFAMNSRLRFSSFRRSDRLSSSTARDVENKTSIPPFKVLCRVQQLIDWIEQL
jgi:hypothetical protein